MIRYKDTQDSRECIRSRIRNTERETREHSALRVFSARDVTLFPSARVNTLLSAYTTYSRMADLASLGCPPRPGQVVKRPVVTTH